MEVGNLYKGNNVQYLKTEPMILSDEEQTTVLNNLGIQQQSMGRIFVKETVLWEDEAGFGNYSGTFSNKIISLNDNWDNYDAIYLYAITYKSSVYRLCDYIVYKDTLNDLLTGKTMYISLCVGYSSWDDYLNICDNTTLNTFDLDINDTKLFKIIGLNFNQSTKIIEPIDGTINLELKHQELIEISTPVTIINIISINGCGTIKFISNNSTTINIPIGCGWDGDNTPTILENKLYILSYKFGTLYIDRGTIL